MRILSTLAVLTAAFTLAPGVASADQYKHWGMPGDKTVIEDSTIDQSRETNVDASRRTKIDASRRTKIDASRRTNIDASRRTSHQIDQDMMKAIQNASQRSAADANSGNQAKTSSHTEGAKMRTNQSAPTSVTGGIGNRSSDRSSAGPVGGYGFSPAFQNTNQNAPQTNVLSAGGDVQGADLRNSFVGRDRVIDQSQNGNFGRIGSDLTVLQDAPTLSRNETKQDSSGNSADASSSGSASNSAANH